MEPKILHKDDFPPLIRYQCANCGNRCLQDYKPDNSICGGCDKPDWKILRFQEHYIDYGQDDWIHPDGEI